MVTNQNDILHQEHLMNNTTIELRDYESEIAYYTELLSHPDISLEMAKFIKIKIRALKEEQEEEMSISTSKIF